MINLQNLRDYTPSTNEMTLGEIYDIALRALPFCIDRRYHVVYPKTITTAGHVIQIPDSPLIDIDKHEDDSVTLWFDTKTLSRIPKDQAELILFEDRHDNAKLPS